MSDDWRGEELIRHSAGDAKSISRRRGVMTTLLHRARRAAGIKNPLADRHSKFIAVALMGPRRKSINRKTDETEI